MAQLHYGESRSREQVLIMDRRMLHFDNHGNFVDEIPYTIKYIEQTIKEVNGLSVLANLESNKCEIAYIINHVYGTFTVNGRASVILSKLHSLDGVTATLTRMGPDYLQNFIVFDATKPLTVDWVKRILTNG